MLTLFIFTLAVAPALTALECGIANPEPAGSARIVGGTPQTYFKYPWFASLHQGANLDHALCAGTLIAPDWVMTAAHCFDHVRGSLKNFYNVTLGIYDKCKDTSTAKTYKTSEVWVHPRYLQVSELYDIALMKLEASSELTPVCLPPKGSPIEHVDIAHVAGFGRLAHQKEGQPCQINEAVVEIFTTEECKYDSNYLNELKDKMDDTQLAFCAGKLEGEVDTCQGDSGGAIFVQEDDKYFARGIASHGVGCGRKGYPGIYTNVAYFSDWINNTMNGIHDVDEPEPEPRPTTAPIKKGCGIVNDDPFGSSRVADGHPQTYFKFPWFASIHRPKQLGRQKCAGSLISPKFVLTAASCFDEDLGIPLEKYFEITFGIFNQCKKTRGARTHDVEKVYIHSEYVKAQEFHDIAIMKIAGFSELSPVCLPYQRSSTVKHVNSATILGFGSLVEENEEQPCYMNEATVEIYTNKECQDQSSLPQDIVEALVDENNAFCAGKMEGGMITCVEDKGGAILTEDYQRYILDGIVSFGFGCGEEGKPSIYTNVFPYLDWMRLAMFGAFDKMDKMGKMGKMDEMNKMEKPKSKKKKNKSSLKRSGKSKAG